MPPKPEPPPPPPKKPWWGGLFSKTPKTAPSKTPLPRAPLPKGSQSYPDLPRKDHQRTEESQTYDKDKAEPPPGPKPKDEPLPLSPRDLRSMKRFPVDDAETFKEDDAVSTTSSFSSMASDYQEDGGHQGRGHDHHGGHSHGGQDEGLELETDILHTGHSGDPFYAPYGFIIMCFFQIIWGLVGVVQTAALRYAKTLAKSYLLLDKNFSDHSPFYLLVGASLTTMAGIIGLIALFCSIRFMLHLIPHFMWIIVTMCLCSSITARGNLESPTISTYYRIFEATAVYSKDPGYLNDNWPQVQPTIWHEMQKTLRCCGVENITDWLHLDLPGGGVIPESCCLGLDDLRSCREALNTWAVGKSTPKEFIDSIREVDAFLNDDSCITALTTERRNHIRDWTIYPIIYLAFHLAMMFNFNFLTQILIHEYTSWQGIARLKLFKSQSTDLFRARLFATLLGMIPFCCKKLKKKAQWKIQKQASQNALSVLKKNKGNKRRDSIDDDEDEEDKDVPKIRRDSIETEVQVERKSIIGTPTTEREHEVTGSTPHGSTPNENVSEWKWKKP